MELKRWYWMSFLFKICMSSVQSVPPEGSIHLSSEILWWPLRVTQAFRQPLPPPFGGVGPRCGSIAAFDGGPVERSLHQTSVDWCPSFARIPVISCVQDSPVSGISISLSLNLMTQYLYCLMLGLNCRNDFIWSDIVICLNCHMFLCVWERERERERERDLLQNNCIKRFNLKFPPSLYMLILVLRAFDYKYW